MTPKTSGTELIELRVQREREWCYARWLERCSFSQIRRLANLPEHEGGLGYDLSESAVKSLVHGAREAAGDLSMGKEERRERQAHEVDERARAARNDMRRAYENGANIEPPQRADFIDPLEWMQALSAYAAAVRATTAAVESADKRLDAAETKEAKLFGLDAPTESKLDVTTHDGVTEELNAMLARAGRKPVEVAE